MFKRNASAPEKRRYKRLDQIFPVEFQLLDEQHQPLTAWHQAFTQDISKGGLCLSVNHLTSPDLKLLADTHTLMSLSIHIPLRSDSVKALAHAAWFKNLKEEPLDQYVIGVSYIEITAKDNRKILAYAWTRSFFKGLAFFFSLCLAAGLVAAGFHNAKLRLENERLLAGLSRNLSHQKNLVQGQGLLQSRIDEMKFLLSQSERKIDVLQKKLLEAGQEDQKTIQELQGALSLSKEYQDRLKGRLSSLVAQKTVGDAAVKTQAQEVSLIQRKILDKLTHWLKTHQNNHTGLVASFEGDEDIRDWSFTYDQALAAIAFVRSGDDAGARKIFDFYLKAQKADSGGFANGYYATSGDVSEFTSHAGPNIWLGLAILQYTKKTSDRNYLGIAQDISRWLETVKDSEGGLRGGKEFFWYSTEHNLDAYAFYVMMFEVTGQEDYKRQAQATLNWLDKNAYSNITAPLVKRGKGDSTIATDTYAWSITAIGPKRLKEIGMDPDAIMDFAINNCSVSVSYERPEGPRITVKGFDFAKYQNLARGGVISCEWTGQMILALKIMAEYYQKEGNAQKSQGYAQLADSYIAELSKMITTSPSPVGQGEFCLPYASQELADTGHGWRTPKGNRTGSVAATAYAILAIKDINPLMLEGS